MKLYYRNKDGTLDFLQEIPLPSQEKPHHALSSPQLYQPYIEEWLAARGELFDEKYLTVKVKAPATVFISYGKNGVRDVRSDDYLLFLVSLW